jgi:FkbM family methyltransferase
MKWQSFLPAPLRWRMVYWMQHIRIARLKRRNPVPELSGIKIPICPQLSDNICAAIYDGYYERAELSTFNSKLHNNDIVFEIGTGIGFLSSYCAMKIGSDHVFTYEANPQLESLIKNVYLENRVSPTLKFGILGSKIGQAKFYVTRDFWASSLLPPSEPHQELTVPIFSLNDEIKKINPTFMIMDIEGGEYDLIRLIDFHTIRKISVELHTEVLGQNKVDEIKEIMRMAGFIIDGNLSRLIPGVKEILFMERANHTGRMKT